MTATVTPRSLAIGSGGPPRRSGAGRRNALPGWLFLSPALLLFGVFILGPFIAAMALSLFSWDLLTPAQFVGLKNFRTLAGDGLLLRALGNTFIFAFASVVTHLVGGLLLALAVNRGINRLLSYFVRTALFFPFLISWAAVALLWKYVLDPTFGIFSYYLSKIGIAAPGWFTDPDWALPSIIGIDFWHTIGYTFLIMLAGLQTVPREMNEAARVDGAGRVRGFVHVTLPLMTPTLFFASVITFIGAFQIFDPVQIITGGGPNDSTITAVMYLYQTGFQAFQIGYASTIALVVFAVIMLVTLLQFWGSRRWVHYG
jgi:multiple sugar transport system permease protein